MASLGLSVGGALPGVKRHLFTSHQAKPHKRYNSTLLRPFPDCPNLSLNIALVTPWEALSASCWQSVQLST